jgi:hypothetical protein
MKTDLKKTSPASEGNPAYPKLMHREAIVKAAAREKTEVRKIPADDLEKTKARTATHDTIVKARRKK